MRHTKRFRAAIIPIALSTFSLAQADDFLCSDIESYFCNEFSDGSTSDWTLLPSTENASIPNGSFDVVNDSGNNVLRYTVGTTGGVIALLTPEALSNIPSADYFVEAKIRPRTNSNTGSKQLYIVGRYQDGNNWYAGALNVQNSTSSTQVEFAIMKDGSITRPLRSQQIIKQGSRDALDGEWYDLRLSMKGDELSIFINGDKVISTTDSTFKDKGQIGLWSNNKAFEIDDIVVGDPSTLPASLNFEPSNLTYIADAGDDSTVYTVTAKKSDGSADTFTATSSDTSVVTVSVDGDKLTLTPLAEGDASITVTTASGRTKILNAELNPKFLMPDASYSFTDQLAPAQNESGAFEDTVLKVTFDSAPTLGKGSIRIFDAEDDSIVDNIALGIEKDKIGSGTVRDLNTNAIRIVGNELQITPHSKALALGKTYYVAIPAAAIVNSTLAGKAFEGIGKSSNWTFTTRSSKPNSSKTEFTVDDNGKTADFRSIQGAINFINENQEASTPTTINVKEGIYNEPLYIYNRNNLTIKGENPDNTIIRYKNNEVLNSGTDGRAVVLAKNSDMLTLENITIHNTTLIGDGHQAEALYFNNDGGKLVAKNSIFMSEQDTLALKGWSWFYKSTISGNVDFIWGYSHAALFEESEIITRADSRGKGSGGYIVQARPASEDDKGFVFLNSTLKRASADGFDVADDVTYLARSGGCANCFDNVVYINTAMDKHIRSVGWYDSPKPNPAAATATAGWREFNSTDLSGEPLDVSSRLADNTYQMEQSEVYDDYCSRSQIFSAYNNGEGWDPMPENKNDCKKVEAAVPTATLSTTATNRNDAVELIWSIENIDISALSIYRDTDSDPAGRTRIAVVSPSATSYTDTTVEADTTYYYWVKYRRAEDNAQFNSDALKVDVPLYSDPAVTLDATAQGSTSVQLDWSVENTEISQLSVYRDTDSNPAGRVRIGQLHPSATSFTDDSVSPGVTYYYWIKVRREADSKDFNSNAASISLP